jgi:pantetheine-phosphate adenylyltransferase
LSSSIVKEIAQFGGAIDHLVAQNIVEDMEQKYRHDQDKSLI